MDEASTQRIPIVGHVVRSVGLVKGLDGGQRMIAHAEEFLTVFNDNPPDDRKIPELVDIAVAHHTTVTANIFGLARIAEQWGEPLRVTGYLAAYEARWLRPDIVAKWRTASYARSSGSYTAEARFAEKLLAALHKAGVPILVGTDTPDVPGVYPGRSAYDEILALKAVGFSNFDSLAAATSVPGRFVASTLPDAQKFGIVAPGYRADLLLLEANPLQSLEAVRVPIGVMVRGTWLPASRLALMIEGPVNVYRKVEAASDQLENDVKTLGGAVAVRKDGANLCFGDSVCIPERLLLLFADREMRAGRPAGAISLLRLAVKVYPKSWSGYEKLGDAYKKAGEKKQAIVSWRHSYAINPKNTELLSKACCSK